MKGFLGITLIIAALFSQSSALSSKIKASTHLKLKLRSPDIDTIDLQQEFDDVFEGLLHPGGEPSSSSGLINARRDSSDPNHGRYQTFQTYSRIGKGGYAFCEALECEQSEIEGLLNVLKIQYNEAAENGQEEQFFAGLRKLSDVYQNELSALLAEAPAADASDVKRQFRGKLSTVFEQYLTQGL
ncbi:UNKNOWN [Stylonychia lemnae]|uniref:Uncharacterized protein n=1 Tax=Stylonychia lemnae TaxID=5949 RepID=A0A078BBH6_STYLE|nr:UNKNOWN [Stylonychia lemnae]|eukprot:CDW90908.1 UNKNOWN [Stylonychia lemnae]